MKRHRIMVLALIALTILFVITSLFGVQSVRQIDIAEASTATELPFTPENEPTPASQPVSTLFENSYPPVRLAWFTNVPRDNDMLNVLHWFDLFIFHRNEEQGRDLMISMGAQRPILQYFLFESIHDPGSCLDEPNSNQVAYLAGDYCLISEQHPDWFLLDDQGQRIRVQDDNDNYYLMDPGNADWRSFFLDRIKQTQADPNWDGVFLDNVPVTLAFRENDGQMPAAYPDDVSYQSAVQGFLKYLYEGFFQPADKLMFANLVSRKDDSVWVTRLNFLDGVMLEGWAIDWPDGYRSPEIWEKQMALAEQTQDMEKTIVLVSQGLQDDRDLQRFALASYLLINHGDAFFRYARSDQYRQVWIYDNYAVDLGMPLGPRYLDGDTWRRDFTNGNVAVNPQTHEALIRSK